MRSVSLAATLSFLGLGLGLLLSACGGRILDERGAGDSSGSSGSRGSGSGPLTPVPAPAPSSSAVPSNPWAPTSGGVADACGTICSRDAMCGAWQSDCNAHCEGEINAASACAPQANAYMHCYADNLDAESCTALPPVCEDAYCAYTRCAGKVVPSYCR